MSNPTNMPRRTAPRKTLVEHYESFDAPIRSKAPVSIAPMPFWDWAKRTA